MEKMCRRLKRAIGLLLVGVMLLTSACGCNLGTGMFGTGNGQGGGIQMAGEGAEDKTGSLMLYLDKTDFIVGESSKLNVTVVSEDTITEPVTVVDEHGETLCTMLDDGTGRYAGQIVISEEAERIGTLTAKSGGVTSMSKKFYVHPEVTEEMMEQLLSVSNDLGVFVLERNYEDPYSEEAFKAVKEWLESNERIVAVEENNGILLFETEAHLIGSYGMSRQEKNSFGFSAPSKAFSDYENGQDLSDTCLLSGIPITNTKIMHLSPASYDEAVALCSNSFRNSEQTIADIPGFSLEWKEGMDANSALMEGDITDCGFLAFNTHGTVIDRRNGGKLLFMYLGKLQGEHVVEILEATGLTPDQFDGFWGSITDGDDSYRLTIDIYTENNVLNYQVLASTNYLECVLADKTFDNTIIYMIICHAGADERLRQLFFDRGASAVLACEQKLDCGVAVAVLHKIAQVMGSLNEKGTYGTLTDLMASKITKETDSEVKKEVYQTKEDFEKYKQALNERPVLCWYKSDAAGRVFEDMGALKGTVVTPEGEVVAGANVSMYLWQDHTFSIERDVVTDEAGSYSVELLPYGIYAVKAEKDGVTDYTTILLDKNGAAETVSNLILELDYVTIYVKDTWDFYKDNGEHIRHKQYMYDKDGNEIKYICTDKDGNYESSAAYQYENNKLMTYHHVSEGGGFAHWEYEYDDNGNLKKMASYSPTGEMLAWEEYTTDEFGRSLSALRYTKEEGKPYMYYDYTWDGDRLISQNEWGEIGGDAEDRVVYRMRYTYDSEGRCICANSEDGYGQIYNMENLYYEDNRMTYSEYVSSDGHRSYYSYYTYKELKVSKEAAERYYEYERRNPFNY